MCSAICIPAVPDVHRNKAKSNSSTGRQGLGWQLEGQGALDEQVAGETQVPVCDCGGDAVKSQQASRMSNHSFVGNLGRPPVDHGSGKKGFETGWEFANEIHCRPYRPGPSEGALIAVRCFILDASTVFYYTYTQVVYISGFLSPLRVELHKCRSHEGLLRPPRVGERTQAPFSKQNFRQIFTSLGREV